MTAELEHIEIGEEETDLIEEEIPSLITERLYSKFKSAQLDDEQIVFIGRNAPSIEIVEAIAFQAATLQNSAPDGASAANQIIYIATQAKSPEVIRAVIDNLDKHLEHNNFYRVLEIIANSANIEEAERLLELPEKTAQPITPSQPVASQSQKTQPLAAVA